MTPDFADCLRSELARRRATNPRYSLRSFARFLGLEHSTLSQILRGRRAVPPDRIPSLANRLRLGAEETAAYRSASALGDTALLAARVKQMSWLGEAAALMQWTTHCKLLALIDSPEWRPDMRWASTRTGLPVDELNEATSRLLRLGLIQVDSAGGWHIDGELAGRSPQAWREIALERARTASAS